LYIHAVNYSSLKENLNLHKSVLADHNYKIIRISRENCNCATLLSGDGKWYWRRLWMEGQKSLRFHQ